MGTFIDLDVSFFDPDFTLSPHKYLQQLYPRNDILGFCSEGMNFVFRFDEARTVLFNRDCAREPLANPEIAEREMRLAREYPNRAKNFALGYAHGTPDDSQLRMWKESSLMGDVQGWNQERAGGTPDSTQHCLST